MNFFLVLTLFGALSLTGCKADPSSDDPVVLNDPSSNTNPVGNNPPVDVEESDPFPDNSSPTPDLIPDPEIDSSASLTPVKALADPGYLPFDHAPRSLLTGSSKKVFAHYFTPYPLSINNKVPHEEYYRVNYLNPYGENGKFLSKGGLLRQKPIDRAPVPNFESYRATDMRHEVRLAANMGLDGFAIDILSDTGTQWERTNMMLDIAAQEYNDFSILLMPDMQSLSSTVNFTNMIKQLAKKPAAYRLPDGRLVVAPYKAENHTPQWWVAQVDNLKRDGVNIVLWPVYQGWSHHLDLFIKAYPTRYRDILYGVSDWGPRSPTSGAGLATATPKVHSKGLKWMSPVAPQDMRPKSSIYTEAGNSEAMRNMWMSAITGDADWVQIISWNDYSEATEVSPSTRTRFGFYDLSTYYTQWFKFGEPEIKRDTLYAFYREHKTSLKLNRNSIQTLLMKSVNNEAPRDQIELLAFLKEPGTLEIEINGSVHRHHAISGGLTSFTIPLEEGRPIFRLTRGGKVIESMEGEWEITSQIEVQNLIYHGMSSRRISPNENPTAISWPWRYGKLASSQKLTAVDTMSPFKRLSNLNAMSYFDPTANSSTGFGYSFLNPSPSTTMTVNFDFNIQASTSGYIGYELLLTDTDLDVGAVVTLGGGAQSGVRVGNSIDGTNKYLSSTVLANNTWYRAELTVSGTRTKTDTYKLRISNNKGVVISTQSVPFDNDINDLNGLIFVCSLNNNRSTKLLVDNVQVSQ